MKGKKRFAYLLLAVCLLVTMLPLAAAAEETAQEVETLDFVLVLDCSGTMHDNDPEGWALSACKMFADMLPTVNARIAAVTFGYDDDSYYAFSDGKVTRDQGKIHNIFPLTSVETRAERDNFKSVIDTVGEKNGSKSPIGHGLAAAVDILTQNGATDGNACIILLSDGVQQCTNSDQDDERLAQSTTAAKSHGWPMYCIELDYENKNLNRVKEGLHADALLDKICKDSGAGVGARIRVEKDGDVSKAFVKMFDRFIGGIDDTGDDGTVKTDPEGFAEKSFSIHELASEVNIAVSGGGVEKLILTSEDVFENGKPVEYVFTGEKDFGNIYATYDPNKYYVVKMIRPAVGDWKMRVYGNPNAEILVHESTIYDAELKMVTKPSRTGVLHRDDSIIVEAFFSYQDQPMAAGDFYKNNPAKLEVYSGSSTNPRIFEMKPAENGYQYELKIGEIPSGEFSICTVVEYSKFRGGAKRSNQVMFESENMGLVVVDNGTTERKAYVNSTFDAVDLNTIFQNPDGDAITYELSSRPVEFAFEISDSGYLTIESGFVPGTHSVELQARDGDMTSPVTHSLSLEVIDRPMEQEKIKPVKVFTDRYGFQKDAPETIELDLNEYITDPDGVEIEYTVHESEAEYFAVTQEGSKICITAVAEGEGTLSITANDKVSDVTFEIEVISGSGKAKFWAENWIWFALGGGLIALIIITIVFISKNTRVKGIWNVTFEEFNNEAAAEHVNIGVLQCSKKKKVLKFRALVDDTGRFAKDPYGVLPHIPNYFNDKDAQAIELKGVPFGTGFVVQKVPAKSEAVSVEYMGKKVTGKVRVTTGYITFRLRTPGAYGAMDEMNITLRSKNR